MTEAIVNFFRDLFGNDYLTTFFIALLPIVELRGAVPVAFTMGLSWWQAFGLAYLGSSIVAPILLLLLKPILELLKKVKFFNRFATAIESMFQDKAKSIAERAGKSDSARKEEWIKIIGVFTFVALPIPLTGVWTGTAVAVFLGVKFWKALGAILLGNFTAGVIMTLLSIFCAEYLDTILMVFFILVILLLALFIAKVIIRMIKSKRLEKQESINANSTQDNDSDNVVLGNGLKNELIDNIDDNSSSENENLAERNGESDLDNLSDIDESVNENDKSINKIDNASK